MSNVVIKNGKINPQGNESIACEIRIEDGVITELGNTVSEDNATVIDAKGYTIFPGFVDVHVHLREPGFEDKETIKTGTLSAAMGGFTAVCPMPNTNPVVDSPEVLKTVNRIIDQDAYVKVFPYAAITKGLRSTELSDFEALKEMGAFAFTNDGVGVQDAKTMYEAMIEAKRVGKALVAHTEDDSLLYGGVMHEGAYNKELGLKGMLGLTESIQIARDVLLAKKTGVHYHVCHVSDKDSVRVIRDAKKDGCHVTCEVSPHHLLLCDKDVNGNDANYKMNPPLRSVEDRQALIEGLLDHTIDFIATDHAPHTKEEKDRGFETAPFGITGSETAFPLLYTHFVKTGIITLKQLVEWMSEKPSDCFGLGLGRLAVGSCADLTIINLNESYTIQGPFGSKATNTPFTGWDVYGRVEMTLVDGTIVYERG